MKGKMNYIYLVFASITVIVFYVLAYFYVSNKDLIYYIVILSVSVFLLMMCIIICLQYIKNKNNEKDKDTLMQIMSEYELILDRDRENRHEMLNNLVVIKSYENKTSKEYERIIDEIIDQYQLKKSNTFSNLYKLPSGIKGIVYYKMNNIINKDIKFETIITKDSYTYIENLNADKYYIICKIIGIFLDNAIEACKECESKEILIDIYTDESVTNIYIENTFNGMVDLKDISKKGYSTKGKNRGLGLHIVNRLIKSNDDLDIEQYIYKDRFVSILKVK